jgi:hypothetical protein
MSTLAITFHDFGDKPNFIQKSGSAQGRTAALEAAPNFDVSKLDQSKFKIRCSSVVILLSQDVLTVHLHISGSTCHFPGNH